MFSIHDILDIAIKIEENGEQTYREASRKVADPTLASLLGYLADQEAEHARWFAEQKQKSPTPVDADSALAEMGRNMLLNVVGDQSFSLSEVDLSEMDTVVEVLDAAFDLENDTVVFYEMLRGFVEDPATIEQLNAIIREEMDHARSLTEYVKTGRVSQVDAPA